MYRQLILVLCCMPCFGLTVTVTGITATQAILTYVAPSTAACTVQVSESVGLSPLIHDVDPTLFSGSNSDTRTGTVNVGLQRSFVVGLRTSALASDGKLYSRALRAFTQHFYQVNCGATASGSFTTANPPLGNGYADTPPFNSSATWNYAWPTINWTDQSQTYIDPLTGIAIKRFTEPGAYGFQGGSAGAQGGGALNVQFDSSASWINPGNITSGSSSTLATSSTTNPMFVAWDSSNLAPDGDNIYGWFPIGFSLDSLQLNVFGNGSSATSGDRTVQVCLVFYDSTNCNSAWFNVVLPQTLVGTPVNYPASTVFPNTGFWSGWGVTPGRKAFGVWPSTVSVSGSTVTNTGADFNIFWKAGAKYFIAGSSPGCTNNLCTIASVQTNQSMTIVESPGTLTSVSSYSAAAGFLVRKATATGSVSISVASQYAVSYQGLLPGAGGLQLCEPNGVTVSFAADGVTPITPVAGELCLINSSGPGADVVGGLYLLIPSTGETRFLNPLYAEVTNGVGADNFQLGGVHTPWGAIDPVDPYTFYFAYIYNSGTYAGDTALVKGQYVPGPECVFQQYQAGANNLPLYATSGNDPGGAPFGVGQFKDSLDGLSTCVTWTNETLPSASRDLTAQITAQSNYKPIWGTPFGVSNILGGKAQVALSPSGGPGLLYVFDLSSGNLQVTTDTFSTYPLRWDAIHAASQQASDRFMGIASANGMGFESGCPPCYVPQANSFAGPYTFTPSAVWKSGAWDFSDTSIPANTSINVTCPSGLPPALVAQGAVGNNCIRFQTLMACNTNPYTTSPSGQTEQSAYPCPYNSAYSMITPLGPGDLVQNLIAVQDGGTVPYEEFQIVQLTSLGSNLWDTIASRLPVSSKPCDPNYPFGPEFWPTGWTGVMTKPCDSDFFIDTTLLSNGYFPVPTGSHYTAGVGIAGGEDPTLVSSGGPSGVPYNIYYQLPFVLQGTGIQPSWQVSGDSFFHGLEAATQVQSYPSNMQLSVTYPVDKNWFLDFHHLNPSLGLGQELTVPNITPFQTPATLVGGTSTVWVFAAPLGTVNFKTQPVVAWAGGYLLQDVSSPATGNIVTDSTPWTFCVVYAVNECRTGSTVGQAYAATPFVGGYNAAGHVGYCIVDNVSYIMPCVNIEPAGAAQIIQSRDDVPDPNSLNWRRLGYGLMGPGRQYQFSTAIPDPTGKWAIFSCNWCDGVRNDLFMFQLPQLPSSTNISQPQNDYQPLSVTLGPSAAYDLAVVQFGYAENGAAADYYCLSRQDTCYAGTNLSPFAYASETSTWASCSGGCAISVPAAPGRMMYYQVIRKNSGSGLTSTGDAGVVAFP
jgi:hypothetical protein